MGKLQAIIASLVALSAATAFDAHAQAEKRVALVIGNSAYKNTTRLPNPKNDAEDVAAALNRLGFETVVGIDLDKSGMEQASIRFARAAREADTALFYYSGHAMQFAGTNYLMPVDAKLDDEADLRLMIKVEDIVADLQQAKNLRILVLDSCRDNPLAEELKRSIGRTRAAGIGRGLAKIDSPQGMILAYATQAGRTADDGSGRNSPYTSAFLKHIEAQDEIGTIFRRISADVFAETKSAQLPELSLSLIGEFYLRGRAASSPAEAAALANEAAQAWTSIAGTSSPAVLEAFIRRFGTTVYADLARARLEELKKSQVAVGIVPDKPAPARMPDDFDAIRKAIPNNVPVNSEVLRTVLTDPFFANAPPLRLARYHTTKTTKNSNGKPATTNRDNRLRSLGGGLFQNDGSEDYSSPWMPFGKQQGTYRSSDAVHSVYAANGYIILGNYSRRTTYIPGKKPETAAGYSSGIEKIDRLTGSIFPVTVGNKFGYRTFWRFSSGSTHTVELQCEVTEKRSAKEFHSELTGEAFLLFCDYESWTNQSDHRRGRTLVPTLFFEELGAFLQVDSTDPNKAGAVKGYDTRLTSFSLVR